MAAQLKPVKGGDTEAEISRIQRMKAAGDDVRLGKVDHRCRSVSDAHDCSFVPRICMSAEVSAAPVD